MKKSAKVSPHAKMSHAKQPDSHKLGKLLMPKSSDQSSLKPRRGGLGRGLDALINTQSAAIPKIDPVTATITALPSPAPSNSELLHVNPSLIHRSPWQPRGTFNPDSLRELAETIKTHGLIQALTCRRIPESDGGGFELISGERRLRAAIDAGLTEIPIRIVEVPDREAAEMAIIENVQRDDLNAIEEAEGYQTLVEKFNLTQQEVADRVGKGRASVAHALRLLDLPDEVKQLVSSGQLSVGHAKVLLSLPDDKQQILLSRKCVLEGLSVRALERLIARKDDEKNAEASRKVDIPESHARFLLEKMHAFFCAPVRLRPSVTYANGKRSKGTIEVDFADNEELTRILALLNISAD